MLEGRSTEYADLADPRLLALTRSGDRAAFDAFVKRHQASVFRFARQATPGLDDAEDVLQEAFLAAWRSAANFRGDGSARAWILGITRNAARRFRRRRVGEPDRFESLDELGARAGWGDDADPARLLERTLSRELLRSALERLSADDREILILRELEGFTGEEVAELLDLSVAAMKSRLHRARLRLASEVRKEVPNAAT